MCALGCALLACLLPSVQWPRDGTQANKSSPAIDTKYFPSIHDEKDLMLDYPRPWKGGLSGGRYTCSTSLDSYGLDGCKHH